MNVIDHRDFQDPQCKPTKPADGAIEFTREPSLIQRIDAELDTIRAKRTFDRWTAGVAKRKRERVK